MTANNLLSKKITQHIVEDGCLPEADEEINDLSRHVIKEMHEAHGECWLGVINLYKEKEKILWKYDPQQQIYNFAADFVLPKYDEQLSEMIKTRSAQPYTGTADDGKFITQITERISQLGGHFLCWT